VERSRLALEPAVVRDAAPRAGSRRRIARESTTGRARMLRHMTDHEPDAAADPARAARFPVITVFTSHWLAMTGLGLLVTSIIVWACLVTARLRRGQENPYIGVATIAAAGLFVLGLLMTPLGLHLGRRRLRKRLSGVLAASSNAWMKLGAFVVAVSLFNLLIASQLTLSAVHAMESRQFCGSCHVMTPEQRAFDQGPHAGILCVDCHVGSGAKGLIASKIQGTKQLIAVLTDKVPKPIVGAIETGHIIPSNETCEQCHWKQMPANASLKFFVRYGDDEANTPEMTLLTMNVGGELMGGVHGSHHGRGISVRFVASDRKRMEIPLVEHENQATGKTKTFVKTGRNAAEFAGQPRITMQCFDCHSRPAHSFVQADEAVDRAIMLGRMSSTLPFVKKTAVEILKAGYADSAAAAAAIPAAVAAYYKENHAELATKRAADVEEAGRVVAELYSRNVFPEYGVDWGTYPNQLGHTNTPGCFRCHDGEHATADGEKITNDCFKCHFPSAVDEQKPEVLKLLGLDSMLNKLRKK